MMTELCWHHQQIEHWFALFCAQLAFASPGAPGAYAVCSHACEPLPHVEPNLEV
jgi:hypothetical protein